MTFKSLVTISGDIWILFELGGVIISRKKVQIKSSKKGKKSFIYCNINIKFTASVSFMMSTV